MAEKSEASPRSEAFLGSATKGSTARTEAPSSDLLPPEIEGIIEELLWARHNDVVEGTVDAARAVIGRHIA